MTINLGPDSVKGQLPSDPYDQLKSRHLAAYKLTDYQRVEQIFLLLEPRCWPRCFGSALWVKRAPSSSLIFV